MEGLIFLILCLPTLITSLQDTTCPPPWPDPKGRESCSCQNTTTNGLRIKCSYVSKWPASTPADTGELLLDGTRMNTTLYSHQLALFSPNLKKFSCSNCGITTIQGFAFFGLNHIKNINLNENELVTIEEHAFSGLSNLKELTLVDSGIVTLSPRAFYSLSNVMLLDLSLNPLYAIEIGAFNNVSGIQQLSFNSIKSERLKSYSLKGLRDIGLLSFTHSEIRKLEPYAFHGVSNVSTISFHSSKLRDVMAFAFVGIGRVTNIKLQSTEISTLTCDVLQGLDCVRTVDWSNSPIRCDCNIQWIIETAANISRDLIKGMTCGSPRHLRHKVPVELGQDELMCNDEERFMGCPPMDTRFPRVRALERYIEDVYRPSSTATVCVLSLRLLFLTILYFLVH